MSVNLCNTTVSYSTPDNSRMLSSPCQPDRLSVFQQRATLAHPVDDGTTCVVEGCTTCELCNAGVRHAAAEGLVGSVKGQLNLLDEKQQQCTGVYKQTLG